MELVPIGVVHSPYKSKGDAPFQGRFSKETMELEIYPEYAAGLKDIEEATHLIVLYWFDRARRDTLQTKTPHDSEVHGVFACRSPSRPNPIAFCAAELLSREGNRLMVRGMEALDGSPLIDIKPYSAQIDSIPGARIGWFDKSKGKGGRKMTKMIVCGRGGSGKSTVVTLLAKALGDLGKVLVVDTDESNLGLCKMLGQEPPEMSLMGSLGGKSVVREKLLASLQQQNGEKVTFFKDDLSLEALPPACVIWNGPVGNLRIGKIEHNMEGCACPMGSITRSLLKELQVSENQWVIADTEAGVEHFGRGILEGADAVLMVVDPSYESVLLAEKAKGLTEEAHKKFFVILNKVDESTEPTLRQELSRRGIEINFTLGYSQDISRANLVGDALDVNIQRENMNKLVDKIIKPGS